jgi:hypothetical protein
LVWWRPFPEDDNTCNAEPSEAIFSMDGIGILVSSSKSVADETPNAAEVCVPDADNTAAFEMSTADLAAVAAPVPIVSAALSIAPASGTNAAAGVADTTPQPCAVPAPLASSAAAGEGSVWRECCLLMVGVNPGESLGVPQVDPSGEP